MSTGVIIRLFAQQSQPGPFSLRIHENVIDFYMNYYHNESKSNFADNIETVT
jgi:hypothetical protein